MEQPFRTPQSPTGRGRGTGGYSPGRASTGSVSGVGRLDSPGSPGKRSRMLLADVAQRSGEAQGLGEVQGLGGARGLGEGTARVCMVW